MLPFFDRNNCRNLSGSTESEHPCKNIMSFYGKTFMDFYRYTGAKRRGKNYFFMYSHMNDTLDTLAWKVDMESFFYR